MSVQPYFFFWGTGHHVKAMDDETEKRARVLWDYLCLRRPLEKSDVIIGLGCHDLRVAERSAQLFLDGWAPYLLFTGYLGKQTTGVWTRPEAEVFRDVALAMGVPEDRILLETAATNTGENIHFSYQTLRENGIPVKRLILVQQPFMERRVEATFLQQWPGPLEDTHCIITSPLIDMSSYPNPAVGTMKQLISNMLGAVERIRDYPNKGFQVKQEIPPEVLKAYYWLLHAGFSPQ
ncbi:uncharacterized protein SCO4629-like isoform X1 [Pygocentrus nattereri]|uniref:DUF218 domain-containing protein n=2 Tax=Pygocentrus nattereri TaxID=42514 RepID=A0A3B4DUS9_PYGNA|nr:uncharacterized protein SCO4629-like isoform X1 [Pygocentrus nattereri]